MITTRQQEQDRARELSKLPKSALVSLYVQMGSLTPHRELAGWRKDELIAQILYVERGYRDQVPVTLEDVTAESQRIILGGAS
jgi:hypothetical protein